MPNRARERPGNAFRQRRNTWPHGALCSGSPTEHRVLSVGEWPSGKHEQNPANNIAEDCGSQQNGLGPEVALRTMGIPD
jgi:hypothetical protein